MDWEYIAACFSLVKKVGPDPDGNLFCVRINEVFGDIVIHRRDRGKPFSGQRPADRTRKPHQRKTT
jgi:hypothetical protein